jgi:hypothetical protein
MKFILEGQEEQEKPTFGEVAKHQFFICRNGRLCQKLDSNNAHILTQSDGKPRADSYSTWTSEIYVTRILPTVVRIEY